MTKPELSSAGFNQLVGLELAGMQGDCYVVELAVKAHHLSGASKVHGGVYMTMLDTAMT